MPGAPEHPVTVEALYVVQSFNDIRSATVADLVSALRAEGLRVIEDTGCPHHKTAPHTYNLHGTELECSGTGWGPDHPSYDEMGG